MKFFFAPGPFLSNPHSTCRNENETTTAACSFHGTDSAGTSGLLTHGAPASLRKFRPHDSGAQAFELGNRPPRRHVSEALSLDGSRHHCVRSFVARLFVRLSAAAQARRQ